jgi:hypothetical protein
MLQHLVGIDEEYVEAFATGFMGQGFREVGLSAAMRMPFSE